MKNYYCSIGFDCVAETPKQARELMATWLLGVDFTSESGGKRLIDVNEV